MYEHQNTDSNLERHCQNIEDISQNVTKECPESEDLRNEINTRGTDDGDPFLMGVLHIPKIPSECSPSSKFNLGFATS